LYAGEKIVSPKTNQKNFQWDWRRQMNRRPTINAAFFLLFASYACAQTTDGRGSGSECKHQAIPTEVSLVQVLRSNGWLEAGLDLRNVKIMAARLGDDAPGQVVLAADVIDQTKKSACNSEGWVGSSLWVLAPQGGSWKKIDRRDFAIDPCWEGTLDGTPGFFLVRAEPLLGACRELLRVEHIDLCGSADPRYFRHGFELFALEDQHLVSILDCPTEDTVIRGPDRDSVTIKRNIRFGQSGFPREIEVRKDQDSTLEGGEAQTNSSGTVYRYVGKKYLPLGKDLCQQKPAD
jgi:hypothetical protein